MRPDIGESFAEALARHEALFPAMYVALIRVGEASGSLDQVLEVLADERSRTEALKRRLGDAIRYPLFVLSAAGCVLLFFLTFVLPQSVSTLANCGRTNVIKNSKTPPAAPSTNSG